MVHLHVLSPEMLSLGKIDTGDTAWMLISTALVLVMTPALAFFYGGMVRSKNALNTKMMSFAALGFIGVAWAVVGYSLAFSGDGKWVGNLAFAGLRGVGLEAKDASSAGIPHLLFMLYQATFAIITPALISGAIVERMRFGAYLIFITAWSLLVYCPIAHWMWGGGWLGPGLGNVGALDFAGGAVVHISAGVAALVAASVLGPRKDYSRQALLPHNVPFVLLGTGLLWMGWFGFNAGSALGANNQAVVAFAATLLAPCVTLVVWCVLDLCRTGKITAVGSATAIVIGLATVTPAAGYVSPTSALLIGAIAAFPSYYAILYRARTRVDDSLDVFSAHGLGGLTGILMVGVFSQGAWSGLKDCDGMLYGNPTQLGKQGVAALVVAVFSGVMTFGLLKLIGAIMPLRTATTEEGRGMDVVLHGEEAYTTGEGAVLLLEHEVAAPAHAGKLPVGVQS